MTPFELICFMALADSHGAKNWEALHWKYLFEKYDRCLETSSAYTAMDRINQMRVLVYCEKWKLQIPEFVKQYEKDLMDFNEKLITEFLENDLQTKGENNDD